MTNPLSSPLLLQQPVPSLAQKNARVDVDLPRSRDALAVINIVGQPVVSKAYDIH